MKAMPQAVCTIHSQLYRDWEIQLTSENDLECKKYLILDLVLPSEIFMSIQMKVELLR